MQLNLLFPPLLNDLRLQSHSVVTVRLARKKKPKPSKELEEGGEGTVQLQSVCCVWSLSMTVAHTVTETLCDPVFQVLTKRVASDGGRAVVGDVYHRLFARVTDVEKVSEWRESVCVCVCVRVSVCGCLSK